MLDLTRDGSGVQTYAKSVTSLGVTTSKVSSEKCWGATEEWSAYRELRWLAEKLPEPQRVMYKMIAALQHTIWKGKCNMAFQKVEVPAGAYMGWSSSKPGQIVEGKLVEYDERGGSDFAKNPCPLVVLTLTRKAVSVNKENERTDYAPGDELSVTCGLANLKKSIKKADRDFGLARGMGIRIELERFEKVPDGKVKVFDVQVDPSTAIGDGHAASGGGADDDDEPPF